MNSISESFKSHPLQLNHIIPLDFNGVTQVPDSHTWTPSNPNSYQFIHPLPTESVPIIDLLGDSKTSNDLIRHACEKWGVFQVTNHSIPTTLLHQIDHQTRRLFSLPAKVKLRAIRSPDGLTGYGMARIARFFQKYMWSEGFSAVGSPEEHARQLWPHDYSTFCYVMEEYQKEMKILSEKIMGLMLRSLGLMCEDVKWFKPNNGSKPPQALLQLNSYPVCPDPSQAMGLAPHTDSSLLTLLYQSNTTGLQVLHGNNGWATVPPLPGALVVNVGDLMHILSNGRFKSALHRAVVNKAQHRFSVAYFFGPPRDAKISPLIKLTDHDHPPLYRSVTWKEYLDAKGNYFNKALDLIRFDTVSTQ